MEIKLIRKLLLPLCIKKSMMTMMMKWMKRNRKSWIEQAERKKKKESRNADKCKL